MLKKISKRDAQAVGGNFAIVAAKYNSRYTDALVKSAKTELRAGGAGVEVVRVPGSFEVPVVARALALSTQPSFDAILCFGAILRGATTHAQQIADAVSQALAQLQVMHGVPIIHGVLLFENEAQAEERCFGRDHNRGLEAARVALEMAAVMRGLAKYKKSAAQT